MGDDRIERARALYDAAAYGDDPDAVAVGDRLMDAVGCDVQLASGRLLHAKYLQGGMEDPLQLFLLQGARKGYRELGDERGEGEAEFWIGAFHQVVRGVLDDALPALEHSRELATRTGDTLTLSYALRHLGLAELEGRRRTAARELLEESTRLRRELGFTPGVAENIMALGLLADEEGHPTEALALLDEARALAESCGAHGVLQSVADLREQLTTTDG